MHKKHFAVLSCVCNLKYIINILKKAFSLYFFVYLHNCCEVCLLVSIAMRGKLECARMFLG